MPIKGSKVSTTMTIKGSDTIPFKRILLLPSKVILLFQCNGKREHTTIFCKARLLFLLMEHPLQGTTSITFQWDEGKCIVPASGVRPFPLREYYHGLAWGRVAFPVRGVLPSTPIEANATIPLENILPLPPRRLLLFPCNGKR